MIKVGVLGATGYAGQELLRILHGHKEVKVTKIISESQQGKKYDFIYRNFTGFTNEICGELDYSMITDGLDVLFTSLPYGVLMEHLNDDILNNVKIIDLGVDYRPTSHDEYRKSYGKEHRSLSLLPRFTYGLSEWNEDNIKSAEHIANPGCFATAIELALLPLFKENLIETNLVVDGKCSLSGSGRTLTLGTHFVEANESVKPYRITDHPHKNESVRAIEYFTQKHINLAFVPHIVPMQRGILVSCYAVAKTKLDYEYVRNVYEQYYSGKPFIQILDKGMYVETKWVKNSNMCHINFELDETGNRIFIFAAIDNLLKGAGGQAIQNFNIMFGFPQNMAIDFVPTCI